MGNGVSWDARHTGARRLLQRFGPITKHPANTSWSIAWHDLRARSARTGETSQHRKQPNFAGLRAALASVSAKRARTDGLRTWGVAKSWTTASGGRDATVQRSGCGGDR